MSNPYLFVIAGGITVLIIIIVLSVKLSQANQQKVELKGDLKDVHLGKKRLVRKIYLDGYI